MQKGIGLSYHYTACYNRKGVLCSMRVYNAYGHHALQDALKSANNCVLVEQQNIYRNRCIIYIQVNFCCRHGYISCLYQYLIIIWLKLSGCNYKLTSCSLKGPRAKLLSINVYLCLPSYKLPVYLTLAHPLAFHTLMHTKQETQIGHGTQGMDRNSRSELFIW